MDLRTFLLALILKRMVRVTLSFHLYREEEGCQSGNRFPRIRQRGPDLPVSGSATLQFKSPRMPFKAMVFELGTDGPRALGRQAGVMLFNLCPPSLRRPATPLFSRFLQNDFPPGGLTGTLIIRLRKMKG